MKNDWIRRMQETIDDLGELVEHYRVGSKYLRKLFRTASLELQNEGIPGGDVRPRGPYDGRLYLVDPEP